MSKNSKDDEHYHDAFVAPDRSREKKKDRTPKIGRTVETEGII